MPERIQQKRTKGWRKPENTVSVARPSKWGNPYKVGQTITIRQHDGTGFFADFVQHVHITPKVAVALYRLWLTHWHVGDRDFRSKPGPFPFEELRGKNLMCFCPLDQPCHADVLLELANKETTDE